MIDTLKAPEAKPAANTSSGSDEERVLSALAAFAREEAKGHPAWLRSIREAARTEAVRIGFPTTQLEEWRFTNMASVLQLPLHPVKTSVSLTAEEIAPFAMDLDCYRLVFVDGHFCASLSILPSAGNDLKVGNLAGQWAAKDVEQHLTRHTPLDENFFTALNTAFFQDGAYISLPAGKAADKPVHVLYLSASDEAGGTAMPRNLILAHRNARLTVLETYASLSGAPRVTNAVTEIVLGEDAHLEHCKLQQESERSFHIATVQAAQARASHWLSHSIATGGRLARNQVQARFNGEGGEAILNGLYLGRADQLIDHHTVVDHATPRCESHEFYRGILSDRAHGVFNGKIFVRQDAQKTNAKQTNRNLLLSDSAIIDTKPQLEIFADDVKCTHGATVGQLNDEAMFYLQARGIGAELARRMLIQAFARDVIDRITIEPARARLEQVLAERF